jgi:release factor glutamine methyltransferase
MKTVREFMEETEARLRFLYEGPELQQLIFMLLEDVKGFSRTDLHMKGYEELSNGDIEILSRFTSELEQGRPVQYVLGYTWFCGMKFAVNEKVLIPRPETEELCEWLLSHISIPIAIGITSHISLLDVGTGSGCIAVALKRKYPGASVHAMDVSGAALGIAMKNAAANGTEIFFHEGDILSETIQKSITTKFDVIVSNPPYVRKSEMASMAENVRRYEPHTALFVDDSDPLVFYRAIASFAKTHLKSRGQLFFEINEAMGRQVHDLLLDKGFRDVEIKNDISGKERMVRAAIT